MSKPKIPFNSAMKSLTNEPSMRDELSEIERFQNERGAVFFHDMNIPFKQWQLDIVERAECIHSQLSWPSGMTVFAERANHKQLGSHGQYLLSIKAMIERLKKPTFLICSKSWQNKLQPHDTQPIKLYGHDVLLAIYFDTRGIISKDTEQLTRELSSRYKSVYDFSCGYGLSIRPFGYIAGSNIDKKCLDYIRKEILCKGGNAE